MTAVAIIVIPVIYALVKGAELGKSAAAAKPGYAART
jgi:Cu(I)/Ag(I) efflux system membrane protein CusA/SilA